MHSSHPSNALFVKHSLHPSNVTLRSHETGAAVIGVSTGAAKPSLKIGHGGLHCRRNTLSLGCIANNANNYLPDFWSTCQTNLICLAWQPRFQLGSRAHPRLLQQPMHLHRLRLLRLTLLEKCVGLLGHVPSEFPDNVPIHDYKSFRLYLRKPDRRFILLDALFSIFDGCGSFLPQDQAGAIKGLQKPMSLMTVTSINWLAWSMIFMYIYDWMGREVYNGKPRIKVDTVYDTGYRYVNCGLILNWFAMGAMSLVVEPIGRALRGTKFLGG
ncbi:hypothetical protein AHAS_Ahas04G0227600 [Arachis hypogaea]